MRLYKYISFDHLLTIIETKQMFLRNIGNWDDPFEGFTPLESEAEEFRSLLLQVTNGSFGDKSLKTKLEQKESILYTKVYENFCFAQSWTQTEEESDAMWRIYSQGKGVRIAVDLDELSAQVLEGLKIKNISNTKVCKQEITYTKETPPLLIDHTNYQNEEILFKQITGFKRKAFEHENEFRIGFLYPVFTIEPEVKQLLQKCDALKNSNNISDYLDSIHEKLKLLSIKSTIDFFEFNIDLSMIKEIVLDPRASSYYTNMFFSYIRNRKLETNHYKSGLYNRSKNITNA